jgi:outer membrane cobalamin receptor
MNKRLTSVFINENVGNPYQPDINYRGYTASPLLGTPEGLSVYLDGVRQNQPFGDVIARNLIPKIAIRDMALIPGSDPVYGLNTLGGVVSVQTKDGLTTPRSPAASSFAAAEKARQVASSMTASTTTWPATSTAKLREKQQNRGAGSVAWPFTIQRWN